LPVFIGEGLKFSRFFLEHYPQLPTHWKTYSATLALGTTTDTLDHTGTVIESRPLAISESELESFFSKEAPRFFAGYTHQMPPLFSAKKIHGERASDLTRQGKEVTLSKTPVTIIWNNEFQILDEGKIIQFTVTVSKGTYIRVLAADLAKALGTIGHLVSLRRTKVGPYHIDAAQPLLKAAEMPEFLNIKSLASTLPNRILSPDEEQAVKLGQQKQLQNITPFKENTPYVMMVGDKPVALAEYDLASHSHRLLRGLNE
jgi:tRNA pseudouridine55 synthase